MKYRVLFINKAFNDVLDNNMLEQFISDDAFKKKQLTYFLINVDKKKIFEDADEYFKYREDIIFKDNEIVLANRITKTTSSMVIEKDFITLDVVTLDNPLVTFLYVYYRPLRFIDCSKIEENSYIN